MKESFKNQSQDEIVPDIEIKETKETEIKPEEFLNEFSGILTAMEETARADYNLQIKEMIREEAKELGIDIEEDEMREIIDDQQTEFKKEVKSLKNKFLKNIAPYVLLILAAFSYWRYSGKEIPFAERHIAQAQMLDKGITDSQRRRAYIPGVSELLEKGVVPYGYNVKYQVHQFIPNLLSGDRKFEKFNDVKLQIQQREDAWRLYLGLPQKHNTFSISNYRPNISKDDRCYYKINNFLYNFTEQYRGDSKFITRLLEIAESRSGEIGFWKNRGDDEVVMHLFKISKGYDEKGYYVSYYDIWDLSPVGVHLVGRSFEIYDRIYYNPETFEVIEPTSK